MAKLPEGRSVLTDEQMIGLTHRLVDTCIDCKGRIEELEEQNKRLRLEVAHANDTADVAIERVKELEAKLAKAVEAMREAIRLADQPHYGDRGDALDHCFDAIDVLRTTIAELTGGKDE